MWISFVKARGVTFFTPHGSDAQKLKEIILSQPESIRNRFLEIEPANTQKLVKVQPLRVIPSDDELVFGGRLASKTGHVGRILLATSGETDFDGAPRKFAWIHRILYEAGRAGLPLPEAQHFLHPSSELFRALVAAVPHMMHRLAFEHFADLPPSRQEELIESVRNRFIRLFANPILELMLGSTHNVFDPTSLMHERKIILVNLHRGDVLSEDDVSVLANLFLAEYMAATFCDDNPPPHWIFLDELQCYRASFPELISVLGQIRKFNKRIVAATQGTFPFPEGREDRLLNTLISNCAATVVLGHNHPVDNEFFAKLVGLSSYDPMREKSRLTNEQQYIAGHEDIVLENKSYGFNYKTTDGGGNTKGTSTTKTWNDATGTTDNHSDTFNSTSGLTSSESSAPTQHDQEQLRQTVGNSATQAFGGSDSHGSSQSHSEGGSEATTEQTTSNWSVAKGYDQKVSYNTQRVPILRWREFVSSITYVTGEEHFLQIAAQINNFKPGQAFVRIGGEGTVRVQFRLPRNPLARTPQSRQRAFEACRVLLEQCPLFCDPMLLQQQRQEFAQLLLTNLRALARQNHASVATPPQSVEEVHTPLIVPNPKQQFPVVPLPENDDPLL